MAFYFVSTFAIAQTPTKQPALRLSRTKNLHFAKATFPGFSAEAKTIRYLVPSSNEWTSLSSSSEEDKDEITKKKEELKNALLSSLQMQNICVLTGSGSSLGPVVKGPSMNDLWQKAAYDKNDVTDTFVQEIANKINFDTSAKRPNIEEFLSLCDAYLQFKDDEDIKTLVNDFKSVILKECSFVNDDTNLTGHEIFLHRLSRRRVRDSRLKIFTTNYR
jgi:hypothetical protein